MPTKKEIDGLIGATNKTVGRNVATLLDGNNVPLSEVGEISRTPLKVVDNYLFGVGGLPFGRMMEVYSEESVGKSAFAMACLAEAQKQGYIGAYLETERRLNKNRLHDFNVNTDELVLGEPETVEEMLKTTEGILYAPKQTPVLLVIDSIAAAPSEQEMENGLVGKEAAMARASALTRAIRVMATAAVKNRVFIMALNHQKNKIGMAFGDSTTTPGGKALKFYATLRLWFTGGKAIKDGNRHIGKDITAICSKTLFTEPWRKAKLRLMYDTGWDDQWSTIDHAKTQGWIKKGARQTEANYEEALKLLTDNGWASRGPH